MKRYSISYSRDYKDHLQYLGRTDDVEKTIEEYKAGTAWGIKITDSKTKEVIFEDRRTLKGELIITTESTTKYDKGETKTYSRYYNNLDEMRKAENTFLYKKFECFKVLKVERIIHSI